MLSTSNISRFASKVLIFNTSPRHRNTFKLLKEVKKGAESAGADVKMVDLFKLNFKGCQSCLQCKKKGAPILCTQKDDFSPYLEQIQDCSGFAIGTPIYMGNFSSSFYQFLERVIYSRTRYEVGDRHLKSHKKIETGLLITMGAPEAAYDNVYTKTLLHNAATLRSVFGSCTVIRNVTQALVDNKDKYDMGMMDLDKIHKWVKEHDPEVLKQAFDLGVKLAGK